ncbi:MAG TPA: CYTH domain-containing protein [Gemmataceae bacterium]|nr:CYTH domain-containing protein [Gemmataceae bacterium]
MQNLEIKCGYADHRLAARLSVEEVHAEYRGRLVQTDTYFDIYPGRLKLRQNVLHPPHQERRPKFWDELIAYRRPNRRSPKSSIFQLWPVHDRSKALKFFSDSFGIKVRVSKSRRFYIADNLRIHVDSVIGLGRFVEFELAVNAAHPLTSCRKQMQRLLVLFKIPADSLVRYSYSDLLMAKRASRGK